jgi:hypothetical protein
MSMADMMKQCREPRSPCAPVDKTLATIKQAKQSNDAVKIRAGSIRSRNRSQMKDHMGLCMKMMDMMKMHAK